MTSTIIKGLRENGVKVYFLAICQIPSQKIEIKEYYKDKVDGICILPSRLGTGVPKYKMLCKLMQYSFFDKFYSETLGKAISCIRIEPDFIIAHAPSLESIFYAKILKKKYIHALYYEYWSDPIALSGITPDTMNIKRFPFKIVESVAFRNADRIIYGTKTLMNFEKKLYPKYASQMTYIDIPYVEKAPMDTHEVIPCSILYAGNYHKNIRNIEPLIEAVESMEGYRLDIYGDGEIKDRPLHNTHVHGRISSEELSGIEGKYEYLVCVLNHSCIQIPGKIFYDMARKVKIIVLADGKYKEELCSYLRQYDRFVVCNNTSSEIKEQIISASSSEVDYEIIKKKFSPKKICSDLLNGGYK